MSVCGTCNLQIFETRGITKLECGHTYHPRCIHSYYRAYSACPICPDGEGTLLDFGDNVYVSNATRESLFVSSVPQAQNSSRLASWFTRPRTYAPNLTPDELVRLQAPVTVLIERNVTLKDCIKNGVTLEIWFNNKYDFDDLKTMGVTWSDMIYMGMTPADLDNVSCSFLVDVLKVNISDLMQIGTTWQHLMQAKYTARDLLALKCSLYTLRQMGMLDEHKAYFKYSDSDWHALSSVK